LHIAVWRYDSDLPAALREELPFLVAVSPSKITRALVARLLLHLWAEKACDTSPHAAKRFQLLPCPLVLLVLDLDFMELFMEFINLVVEVAIRAPRVIDGTL
jgi:hypothetical protein